MAKKYGNYIKLVLAVLAFIPLQYLWPFVNWEQNDWVYLLLMAKFAYNNAKNASTGYTLFELNYSFYPQVFFKDNIDYYSKTRSVDKLVNELRELIDICQQNLLYAQEL